MNVMDAACVRLAKDGLIPGFGANEAKVLSKVLKYRKVTLCALHYLTGLSTAELKEILQALENAGIIESAGATYTASQPGEALLMLIELAEGAEVPGKQRGIAAASKAKIQVESMPLKKAQAFA